MLVWMDLEMTGLDHTSDVIVEIATIITDDELNIVAEGPDLVVHQPDDLLAKMDAVVVDMHTRSGLLDQIKASTITLEEAWALARYIRTFSQPAAERPDTSRSVLPQNIAPRSASGVTYRRTPQQPVDVALRPNAPKRSNTSKNPLSWLIPFDKSQSSAEK